MSLQVWLPLTKDLRQQGINKTTIEEVTSTVFDNGGKLGKCLSGGKIKIPANQVSSIFNNTSMSIAFWYNNNTSETTGNHAICGFSGNTEGDTGSVRIWDFFNYSNPNTFHWSMGTLGGGSLSNIFPANTWVHVCVTWNAPTLKIYMDGILKYTGSGSSNYTFDKSYYISFGHTPQKLNDFRIYDHCLSLMEVKELAKGLVLHYPLNRQGWGQENIIPNSKIDGSWTYPSSSVSDKYSKVTTVIPSATQYTLSFDAKSTVNGDKMRTHYYSPNTTTTCVSSQGITKTASDGNMDFTLSTQWQRYWVIYTQTETTAVKHLICPRLVSGQGSGTVSVKNVKLEEGPIATPWCPNSSDTLATTMGLNSITEYDCSGFGNNGTKNNITYTSDTPKYTVSSVFNGSNSYIKVNDNNWMVKGMSEMTVNLWAKASTWPTGGRLISCTESGGFNLEAGNSGYWRFPIYVYTNSDQTSSAYKYDSKEIKLADLTPNEWNMITLVYNGDGTKTYINGELHHTYTNTSYGINFNTNARLFLGCEANTASPSSPYFNGNECDFRIYTTALSADDIKSLYQNSAYIDSSGNVYGAIHEEV